jgi:hypothetical protein
MTDNNCQLELDTSRGVLYVHTSHGRTVLRIRGFSPRHLAEFDPNIDRIDAKVDSYMVVPA